MTTTEPASAAAPAPTAGAVTSSLHQRGHDVACWSYEVVPLPGVVDAVVAHVPRSTPLSVTASPARGQDATLAVAEQLAARGCSVAPHLSARLLRSRAHLAEVVDRCRSAGVEGAFVVGGDPAPEPSAFADALEVLEALAELGAPFRSTGVAGHPGGIPGVDPEAATRALVAKAALATHVVTQMAFDAAPVVAWARGLADRGVALPVHVGVAGAVPTQKLLRISARLGLGEAARFAVKQQGAVLRLLDPRGYRPDALLRELAPHLADPDSLLAGVHVFTFNALAETEAWRRRPA
ncbi:methylenetetrahydrofolate reductase [Quadrisphaera sp. KR29]|uniref:methylenetetrahydrofolate reductase n=1 Tax=Quadrisphaera sp. KR29 TaxID=3461391 RepID=UPI004043D2BB